MATQRPRMPTHAISLRPAPGSKTTSAGSQASRRLAIRLSRRICKRWSRMRAATSASPPSSGPNTIERWHGGRRLGGQRIVGAR